jgi:hypothetical protein
VIKLPSGHLVKYLESPLDTDEMGVGGAQKRINRLDETDPDVVTIYWAAKQALGPARGR